MNKIEPIVSVIVPVYNVELYLKRCLDSIIKQTLANIEIILVDDGSTDNSGKICDEFAQKDFRIVENLQHTATTFIPRKRRRYGLCGTIGIDKNEKKEYNIYIRSRELSP